MSFVTDKHEVLDGLATVLRTSQSGDVWQLRMYVRKEQKHYRRSLKTRDLQTALQRGREEASRILSDVHSGRKIFGATLQEVVDEYVEYRQQDVDAGNIVAGRLVTIKSQLNHLLKIVGANTRISELDRDSLYDWLLLRQQRTKNVQKVTVRNEQATLNHLCKFAYRKGLIHFDSFNFRTIRIRQDDIGKRDSFSLEEYDALCGFMRRWVAKKNCSDDEERRRRCIVRDYVLISSNSLMRVGELRQLLWGDVRIERDTLVDRSGKKAKLAHIHVRSETSKVRNSRTVVCRGGEYFERLQSNSLSTDSGDLVFSFDGGANKIDARRWAKYWRELMDGIEIPNWKDRNLTWYSLRHFGITCRIRARVDVVSLAKMAGTSISH